jgi:glutamyl-tRNA synthetase
MTNLDPRHLLLISALSNAVKHQNVPKAGAVLGMVLAAHPELKPQAGEMKEMLATVISEIDSLSHDERRERLLELAPDQFAQATERKVKEKRDNSLFELPEAENGVVMRFAPNPSGPLHLGHARAAYLNDAYVKRYGGRYVLRMEDTDPKRVDPLAYEMIAEDLAWMEIGITETVYQSDRFSLYYEVGAALIEKGHAYVCECESEAFRSLKMAKKSCSCRSRSPEESLFMWEKMIEGEYQEGSVSVRLKTDMQHPDPAIRDFPLFRVLDSTSHERIDACVYPLMNLSVAVDDHGLGVTHVIRGKDHIANTRRQKYIFDYLGWATPYYYHYGRMSIEGLVLSTSAMREGINSGLYSGWDDPRLGTMRALKRRGIVPEAISKTMIDIGVGETDISFSWDNLYAQNKAIVDPVSDRFFFVGDPAEMTVTGIEHQLAQAQKFPGDPSRGTRSIPFEGLVLVQREDIKNQPKMVRLKDLFNVIPAYDEPFTAAYAGESLADARTCKAPIVQWLPKEYCTPCIIHSPDGEISGFCEKEVSKYVERMVQFERVGFVKIDNAGSDGVVAYYCHH